MDRVDAVSPRVPAPESDRISVDSESRFGEDLPQLAAASFVLGLRLCGSCRTVHTLWPYLRAARMVGAVEAGRVALEGELVRLLAGSRRRVLIAGAADTGQLASVARAAVGLPIEIFVVDLCKTPLELCRQFAERWSLPVETAQADLTNFEATGQFDLVIAHSLLQLIAAERRADVLFRLGRSLRPDGRLVHVFNTAERIPSDIAPSYRGQFANWTIDELVRGGIALPEPSASFRQRLVDYAQERERWEGAFPTYEVVEALMRAGGLATEKCLEVGTSLARPYQQFVSNISKRRYLVVAERV